MLPAMASSSCDRHLRAVLRTDDPGVRLAVGEHPHIGGVVALGEHHDLQGYSARIEYDDDDRIFTGRIAGIRDGVSFHADSVDGLRHGFREAVEDYLDTCVKVGKERRSIHRSVADGSPT